MVALAYKVLLRQPKLTGKSQTEVISFEEVVHPAEKIREALQVGKNEAIYELIRRRMLDGEPMTVENLFATGIRTRPYEARLRGLSFLLNREERRDCLFASRN